ncbi:MAG: 4Fe-4S binding protein [Peptococcaceae bacterium]|nr:4Fe-4S binding protein [Peptococcaceae bacterium]
MQRDTSGKKLKTLRHISQISLVALVVYLGFRHQYGTGISPLDSYCPLGGVESLYTWVTTGKMLPKTGFSNFILLGTLITVTLAAGGVFCGWFCPVGTVQDWLYVLRRKVVKAPIQMPRKLDKGLRGLKYVVLILVLGFTIQGVTLWFADYDPFKALFAFELKNPVTYVVLGLTIVFSLLVERFWCKYLCPLGAILAPLAKLGILQVSKTEACSQCNTCLNGCPMGLSAIGELGCVNCMECVSSCHKPQATVVQLGKIKRPLAHGLVPVTGVLLGVGLVLGSMGMGIWETRTTMSRVAIPSSIASSTSEYPPVESITGMTFLDEVAKTYDLEAGEILKKAGLDPNQDPHRPVKDITKPLGVEVESVRAAVSELIKSK